MHVSEANGAVLLNCRQTLPLGKPALQGSSLAGEPTQRESQLSREANLAGKPSQWENPTRQGKPTQQGKPPQRGDQAKVRVPQRGDPFNEKATP